MGSVLWVLLAGACAWWVYERRRRTTHRMSGGLHADVTLPHVAEWELYHNSISLCSRKLRLCLDELDLPWVSHPIELIETGRYENIGRRYLAVNPAGLVPVLVHHGHPIYESHEAIRYAAEQAGARGRSLIAPEPALHDVVEHWKEVASLVGDDPTQNRKRHAGNCIPGLTLPIFATMVEKIPYWRIAEGLLFHPDKRRPALFILLKLRGISGLAGMKPAVQMLRGSRDDMAIHLDALDAHLAKHGRQWIAGDSFSLADVSWAVVLDRLDEVDWSDWFWGGDRRPHVRAYFDRLRARPSFATAITAWRDPLTQRGSARVREAKSADPRLREALEGSVQI